MTVSQTLASIQVTPFVPYILTGGTQQFSATGLDQFGKTMATQPAVAGRAQRGHDYQRRRAADGRGRRRGGDHGDGDQRLDQRHRERDDRRMPSVAKAAAAAASTVTGNSVALSVLGAFAGGECYLKYTWAATTLPTGAAAPIFATNGTNGGKNTAVTFTSAGALRFHGSPSATRAIAPSPAASR